MLLLYGCFLDTNRYKSLVSADNFYYFEPLNNFTECFYQ